jgi:hypothetical protein
MKSRIPGVPFRSRAACRTAARVAGSAVVSLLAAALALGAAAPARAQDAKPADPSAALTEALVAACRADETRFAKYLTAANASAFLALPVEQRRTLLGRISLLETAGKPLISSDASNHTEVRCQGEGKVAEFRMGDARVHDNLAFIPVNAGEAHQTEFGLVREDGGWRLLSLGLVLLDIPKISKEWVEQDLAAREDAVIAILRSVADAIGTYRRAFGKLPESLAQMGPAPENGISPEQANLVNDEMAAGSQNGYQFRYRIVPAANESDSTFELAASPEEYGKTGKRSFFLDARGKVHAADKHGRVATFEDPLIAGEKAD